MQLNRNKLNPVRGEQVDCNAWRYINAHTYIALQSTLRENRALFWSLSTTGNLHPLDSPPHFDWSGYLAGGYSQWDDGSVGGRVPDNSIVRPKRKVQFICFVASRSMSWTVVSDMAAEEWFLSLERRPHRGNQWERFVKWVDSRYLYYLLWTRRTMTTEMCNK